MIQLIEELSFNAWPALKTVYYDGWLLRFANGNTRRANSVNPLYTSTEALQKKLQYCEALYTQHHQETVFKLTEAANPPGLEAALEARGYVTEVATSVQILDLANYQENSHDEKINSTITAQVNDSWLENYFRLNQRDVRYLPVMRQMLAYIVPQTAYIKLEKDGVTMAIGLGVLERGYLGLFDIVVAPEFRRQGIGRTLVFQLLSWGKTNGARQAYLQVVQDNAPAKSLYAGIGFHEVYQYWYRVKPHHKLP